MARKSSKSTGSTASKKARKAQPAAIKGTQRFKLKVRQVTLNASHAEIARVQHFLRRLGYLKAGFEQSVLDKLTQESLKAYQSYMGIPTTGVLDPVTADELEKHRCGVPDIPSGGASAGSGPLS